MVEEPIKLDVAVVGGGPAGISASIELCKKASDLKIGLFESDEELGGVPRTCRFFFGMRDLKRVYTGPGYVRKLTQLVRETPVEVYIQATVAAIVPGTREEGHSIHVVSPQGVKVYRSRFLLLATGCCEGPFAERLIPSARPAGIFTTWQVQQLIHLHHLKPGNRAVILGSEDAALSTVMTLRRAGVAVAGMVEEDDLLQTYPLAAATMSRFYGFPIYQGTSVQAVSGVDRVEGVELLRRGEESPFRLECDTVVVSGRFRPISQLIDGTMIERDPATSGPVVDMNLETSIPGIFAAGNVLRGGDMHDLCALEGRLAARGILGRMASSRKEEEGMVSLSSTDPIRYVVPQRISFLRIGSSLGAGAAIQLSRTLRNPTLEARSGDRKIWEKSYTRLVANHRIPIPVERFDWEKVDLGVGIHLTTRIG